MIGHSIYVCIWIELFLTCSKGCHSSYWIFDIWYDIFLYKIKLNLLKFFKHFSAKLLNLSGLVFCQSGFVDTQPHGEWKQNPDLLLENTLRRSTSTMSLIKCFTQILFIVRLEHLSSVIWKRLKSLIFRNKVFQFLKGNPI